MKRIKMLTLSAGPNGAMHPGKTYPVDDKTAAALVKGGYAAYAQEPRMERATKPPEPEKAVKPEADEKKPAPQRPSGKKK